MERYILTLLFASAFNAVPGIAQYVQWEVADGGNGHYYRAIPSSGGLNWELANQLAESEGGYLATIGSVAENTFVFGLVDSAEFWTSLNGSGPALGGFQADFSAEPDQGWGWITGEPWGYTNWSVDSPDDGFGFGENRLQFFSGVPGIRTPTWNDLFALDFNLGGYIVEKNVPEPASLQLALVAVAIGGYFRRQRSRR
jgi:hypothetical protein